MTTPHQYSSPGPLGNFFSVHFSPLTLATVHKIWIHFFPNFQTSPTMLHLVIPAPQPQTFELGEADYKKKQVSSSIFQQDAVAYVAGYLLKKFFTVHGCYLCKEATMCHNADASNMLYCYFKNYKRSTQSQGLGVQNNIS